MAHALVKNNRVQEAKEIIHECISEWAGTDLEVQILMANSQIQVELGEIKKAIDILKTVDPSHVQFSLSRKQMADIYLTHLKDRRNYAKCYADLIEAQPTYENYKMLARALMNIQEPEEAKVYFQKALELNQQDEDIVRDIGQCMVDCHDYKNVIS